MAFNKKERGSNSNNIKKINKAEAEDTRHKQVSK
jgi:hypothetical protein